jgi:hypothetical protein
MKKLIVLSSLLFAVPFISSAYTIDAGAGTGGTISPSGSIIVVPGGSQSFSIGAQGGSHITDVSVDGVSVGTPDSYLFDNLSADHSIFVSAASNGSGGLIYCSGPLAPGWNVSLPNGGCGAPPAPVYLPTKLIKNSDGSSTLTIAF